MRGGETMERKFEGVWIPAALFLDRSVSANEKILLADIKTFAHYWKSNKSIAEFLGVSESRVQQILRSLKERGIIETVIDGDSKREIRISKSYWDTLYAYDTPDEEAERMSEGVEKITSPGGENYTRGVEKITSPGWRKLHPENTRENTYENTTRVVIGDQRQKAFKAPTVEEVAAYITEKRYSINPEAFVSYYEARGWMLGKTKMKSWRAACRTWQIKNDEKPSPAKGKGTGTFAARMARAMDALDGEPEARKEEKREFDGWDKERNKSLFERR